MLVLDVDGDGQLDVIAEALPDIYWLKPLDRLCNSCKATKVASIPQASHRNSQGYRVAQLLASKKPRIMFACEGIYYVTIPDDPTQGNWPATRACAEATDEGFAVADFGGNGRLDIAASYSRTGPKEGSRSVGGRIPAMGARVGSCTR